MDRCFFSLLTSFSLLFLSQCIHASPLFGESSNVYVSADLGPLKSSVDGYSRGDTKHLEFGVRYADIQFNLNWAELVDLNYLGRQGTDVNVEGLGLGVDYIFTKNRVALLVGGGVFQSKASYRFQWLDFPKEKDLSPYVQGQFSIQIIDELNGFLSYRRYYDVSGSDLSVSTIGLRYYFGSL